MKKCIKRVILLILCLVLALTTIPVQTRAESLIDTLTNGINKLPKGDDKGVIASGTDNGVEWQLVNDRRTYQKFLVVKADGKMPDYLYSNAGCPGLYAPWVKYRYDVLVLEGNITRIGNNAFEANDNWWSGGYTIIPDTVTAIGSGAFGGCNPYNVIVPDSVVTFGTKAIASVAKIYCNSDSEAAKYAKKNRNRVEYLDKPTYSISYNLDGGTNASTNLTKYMKGDKVKLSNPSKRYYKFLGWYDAKGKKVTKITDGNYSLTAKWKSVTVKTPKKPTLKKISKSKFKVSTKAVKDAKGYEIEYTTKQYFWNAKKKVVGKKTCNEVISKLKGKKYYVRVRAFCKDSTGEKVYGEWSKTQAITLKK